MSFVHNYAFSFGEDGGSDSNGRISDMTIIHTIMRPLLWYYHGCYAVNYYYMVALLCHNMTYSLRYHVIINL